MKSTIKLYLLLSVIFSFYALSSCEKEFDYGKSQNAVKTLAAENILQTSAMVAGTVITDNGAAISSRGICYGLNNMPLISGLKKQDNYAMLGDFNCLLDSLSPGSIYYSRAYATNSYGTAYGNVVSFTTQAATVPIISTTTAPTLITSNSVSSGGNITNSGASNVTRRGLCWSVRVATPTISDSATNDGSGAGVFVSNLTRLSANTRYYIRAYATNSLGTAYGDVKSFTTLQATIPVGIITTNLSVITQTTSTGGGSISSDGGASITSRGVCWSNANTTPTTSNSKTTDGAGIGSFTSFLTGMIPGTLYYVRAYATNAMGTAYGTAIGFTTLAATIPTGITTNNITSIGQTTAISGGIITADGGAAITSRGICWSNTTSSPTTSNTKTINGSGIGSFSSDMTGLLPGNTYYVRAYATNASGTAYGAAKVFTTISATIPLGVTTTNLSAVTQTTSTGGGSIASDGGTSILSRGVCWSNATTTPTTSNSKTVDGVGIGSFISFLTGMTPGTVYYVRAYATNAIGTAYGTAIGFTTLASTIPTGITTNNITSIGQTTALSGGSITADGGAPITSRGICWSNATSSPTTSNTKTINGTGIGSFSSDMTGLLPGTTYYVRAYASNTSGTAYGAAKAFTTMNATLPSGITTSSLTSITATTALGGGSISYDGGATITARGVCWSNLTSTPTISNSRTINGSGTGSFSSSLTNLTPGTTYYVRAYATNVVGTSYGGVTNFTTGLNIVVGASYQGGIVAYIFAPGDAGYVTGQIHGLITATSNQSAGSQWGCSGTLISGTSTALGTGLKNTTVITGKCVTSSIAASICNNLNSGGYSDWYLPSRDELDKLYLNRNAIGGFIGTYYWTSSEANSSSSWNINFANGASNSSNSKTNSFYVRAIRAF